MMLIPLTQGMFAMVDDEDHEELNRYRWRAHRDGHGGGWYAARGIETLRMHTAITGFQRTDHIDGNGLNNQRHNLRDASRSQNGANRRKRPGTSKYKGVSFARRENRWQVGIRINGADYWLGYFDSEEDAARAYDAAARELFGPYATLNFPRPGERSALTGELVAALTGELVAA